MCHSVNFDLKFFAGENSSGIRLIVSPKSFEALRVEESDFFVTRSANITVTGYSSPFAECTAPSFTAFSSSSCQEGSSYDDFCLIERVMYSAHETRLEDPDD